jgi:hypothetical protein
MTKSEWDALSKKLSLPWDQAKLLVDGYEVTYEVGLYKMQLNIRVYVNGIMKSQWCKDKTDEAIRFCCKKTARVYSPSDVKRITKGFGKSFIKRHFSDLEKSFDYYVPTFTSFATLKRQLIANNKSIEMAIDAVSAAIPDPLPNRDHTTEA